MLTTIIIFFLAAVAATFVSQFLSDRKDKRDTKPTLIKNPQDWADRCFDMLDDELKGLFVKFTTSMNA